MPPLRSTPDCPRSARQALLDALRPTRIVGSDGEQHALPDGIAVEEGDALVVATSGTSGHPKGVVLTHDAVAASAAATSVRLGVDPARHAWLACLPLAHIGGLAVVTRSIVTGTPLVVLPGFEAEVVEGSRALGAGVPRVVGRDGAAAPRPLGLRPASSSAAASVPDALPPNVVATYGMTETGSGVVYDGGPLDGVELSFRPRHAGRRRHGGDGARRRGRDPDPGPDAVPLLPGRTTTGGWSDPTGRGLVRHRRRRSARVPTGKLVVSGRIDDVITTGAEKVWPDVVERVLIAHPGVAEVAVWKRPDPEWGERVVAWVVPTDDGPSLDELRQMVTEASLPGRPRKSSSSSTTSPHRGGQGPAA